MFESTCLIMFSKFYISWWKNSKKFFLSIIFFKLTNFVLFAVETTGNQACPSEREKSTLSRTKSHVRLLALDWLGKANKKHTSKTWDWDRRFTRLKRKIFIDFIKLGWQILDVKHYIKVIPNILHHMVTWTPKATCRWPWPWSDRVWPWLTTQHWFTKLPN